MLLIKNWRQPKFLAAIAIIIVAVVVGLYYFNNRSSTDEGQSVKYSSQLEDYKLDSLYKDKPVGISFKKPAELKQKNHSVSLGRSQAFFSQSQTTEEHSQDKLAYLGASSIQSSNAANDSYLKFLGGAILNPSSKEYLAVVSPIKEFIRHSTDNRVIVELTSAKNFKNTSISKNAWILDFKATTTDNGVWPIKGKVILAAGNRTFYYFMVGASESNWQANQKVWQQVIDSLKIDQ